MKVFQKCVDRLAVKVLPASVIAKRGQRGFSLVEVGVFLGIVAIVGIALAPQIGGMFDKNNINQAQTQMTHLVLAAQEYRNINGDYLSISITELHNRGYQVSPFGTGTAAKNAFGITGVQITPDNTGATADLTYPTGEEELCKQTSDRITLLDGVDFKTCDATSGLLDVTIKW